MHRTTMLKQNSDGRFEDSVNAALALIASPEAPPLLESMLYQLEAT